MTADNRIRLRAGFDRVAPLYDRIRPAYPPALFDDLAELAGIGPGCRVLEIGCGTGQATVELARRGCDVLAIELENLDGFKPESIRALPEVVSAELRDGVLRVGVKELTTGAPAILRWLAENGHRYQHVASERPDLETVFLTLTGRSLRDS